MKSIGRTSRCAILYRGEMLRAFGLSGTQHLYILNVCRNPGVTQDELVHRNYVNKSNVARQLAQLEENGFVLRRPGENDRRQMLVFPTQKAREVYPRVCEVLQEWNAQLLQDFSPEEQELLVSMMEKVMNKAVRLAEACTQAGKAL